MSNEKPAPKTRTSLLIAALVALLALGAVGTALAQQGGGISDARAREIALSAVPGQVIEVEREGRELEVVVRATDGSLKEVELDARTGRILSIEDEDGEDGEENESDEDEDEEVDED